MLLRRKKVVLLIVAIVIVSLAYIAYRELVKEEELKEEWTLEVYFNGKEVGKFSISWLKNRCVEVRVGSTVYEGVPLKIVLEACKIKGVKSFIAVGADGYHKEIDGTYLNSTYVAIMPEESVSSQGPLRLIVIGLSKKYWVKFLVKIEVKG